MNLLRKTYILSALAFFFFFYLLWLMQIRFTGIVLVILIGSMSQIGGKIPITQFMLLTFRSRVTMRSYLALLHQ